PLLDPANSVAPVCTQTRAPDGLYFARKIVCPTPETVFCVPFTSVNVALSSNIPTRYTFCAESKAISNPESSPAPPACTSQRSFPSLSYFARKTSVPPCELRALEAEAGCAPVAPACSGKDAVAENAPVT